MRQNVSTVADRLLRALRRKREVHDLVVRYVFVTNLPRSTHFDH